MSVKKKNKVKRISETEYEAYLTTLKDIPSREKTDNKPG